MDSYPALTSWSIFGAIVLAGCYYYWPRQQHRQDRRREDAQHAAGRRRRNEQDNRGKPNPRKATEQSTDAETKSGGTLGSGRQQGAENSRKRKLVEKQPTPVQAAPSVTVQAAEPDENDSSTRQWAQQMMQARKGHELKSVGNKEQRVKTVKQSSALNTPVLSSGSSQADDDLSPAVSPDLSAGDVSDMLEPVASGPSTLRVTAPTKPQKERVVRRPKEEEVETKKQRQNRQRVEERRVQREADERERKAMEEKQRRSAREARGEPAKNGVQPARQPDASAWKSSPSTTTSETPVAVATTNHQPGPLLDTFDADSLSSSNGGMEASTAATSTTSAGGGSRDRELPSEEEQMAQAMKQSEDESGWTTVAQPKKPKKKTDASFDEPVLSNKTNIPASKPMANGKPKGFQALDVQYEQRTEADPSDASNWDA